MNLKIQSIKINTYNCVISVYFNVTHFYLSVHTSASLRDFVSLVNLLLSFFIFLKRFLELLSRTD